MATSSSFSSPTPLPSLPSAPAPAASAAHQITGALAVVPNGQKPPSKLKIKTASELERQRKSRSASYATHPPPVVPASASAPPAVRSTKKKNSPIPFSLSFAPPPPSPQQQHKSPLIPPPPLTSLSQPTPVAVVQQPVVVPAAPSPAPPPQQQPIQQQQQNVSAPPPPPQQAHFLREVEASTFSSLNMTSESSTTASSDTVTSPPPDTQPRSAASTPRPRSMSSASGTRSTLFDGLSMPKHPQFAPSSSGFQPGGSFSSFGVGGQSQSASSSTGPRPASPSPSIQSQSASSQSQAQLPTANNPMHGLQLSLISGRFSDLTIKHKNRHWQAHRVVVCSQSSVLEAIVNELGPAVRDVLTSVLQYPTLDLEDEKFGLKDRLDHEAVVSMMEYLYSTTYTTVDKEPDFSLAHHAGVFHLAISLNIPGLLALSAKCFEVSLINRVKDLNVYFQSVKWVYAATTPEHPELRQILVNAAVTEMPKLLLAPADRSRFLELTSTVKDFQADIYIHLMQTSARDNPGSVLCEDCGPRDADDGYLIAIDCSGCGKEKNLEFH